MKLGSSQQLLIETMSVDQSTRDLIPHPEKYKALVMAILACSYGEEQLTDLQSWLLFSRLFVAFEASRLLVLL